MKTMINRRQFLVSGGAAALAAGCTTGNMWRGTQSVDRSNSKPRFHVFSKMFQPPVTKSPEELCDLMAGAGYDGIIDRDGQWIAKTFEDCGFAVADLDLNERKRTFWLSVGAGQGDPYELYYDESRPEVYEKFDWRQPRK